MISTRSDVGPIGFLVDDYPGRVENTIWNMEGARKWGEELCRPSSPTSTGTLGGSS